MTEEKLNENYSKKLENLRPKPENESSENEDNLLLSKRKSNGSKGKVESSNEKLSINKQNLENSDKTSAPCITRDIDEPNGIGCKTEDNSNSIIQEKESKGRQRLKMNSSKTRNKSKTAKKSKRDGSDQISKDELEDLDEGIKKSSKRNYNLRSKKNIDIAVDKNKENIQSQNLLNEPEMKEDEKVKINLKENGTSSSIEITIQTNAEPTNHCLKEEAKQLNENHYFGAENDVSFKASEELKEEMKELKSKD